MALIDTKSLQDFLDTQLTKWKELQPNINTSNDSMTYIDASVIAELAYVLQSDAITLVNNAFLAYATGDELSNLGLDRGITRKSAVQATGLVRFGRDTISLTNFPIALGTIISTEPNEADGVYVSFQTTLEKILTGQLASPAAPSVSPTINGAGRFTPATYKFAVTAFDANGETLISPQATQVVVSTSSISLSWVAITGATKYGIYFASGAAALTKAGESLSNSYAIPDTGILPGTAIPVANTTGMLYIDVPVVAVEAGLSGNVSAGNIINFINKPTGIDWVTNSTDTSGGIAEEDDTTYRERIRTVLSANTGKVTVNGYKQTAMAVAGVANAEVIVNGVGALRNDISIIITGTAGNGVPDAPLIASVQAAVTSDDNRAVCDNITVTAPTTHAINVTVNVTEYDTAYDTVYLQTQIVNALNTFFPTVQIGGKVYVVEVANIIHDIEGIIDFTLSAPGANVTLGASEMAISGTISVTF